MEYISETVHICPRGHGEFHGKDFCPGCEDNLPPQFIPMTEFEYDLTIYGGDYDGMGNFIFIPQALIEYGKEEEAFEAYTSFNRCHIISYHDEEEGELEGEKLVDRLESIEWQQRLLHDQQIEHYCQPCDSIN